jgi:ATP-dependent Lon protease
MEREISSVFRKVARKVVIEGKSHVAEITPRTWATYLGIPRFRKSRQEERNEIGSATGLAWTEVGGEILPIEVTLMPGKGSLRLTGKLGDVMQESAHAALSYVRSRAETWGIEPASTGGSTSTSTCPEGPSPRTGPRPGSPWPPRSSPRWPRSRCGARWP